MYRLHYNKPNDLLRMLTLHVSPLLLFVLVRRCYNRQNFWRQWHLRLRKWIREDRFTVAGI